MEELLILPDFSSLLSLLLLIPVQPLARVDVYLFVCWDVHRLLHEHCVDRVVLFDLPEGLRKSMNRVFLSFDVRLADAKLHPPNNRPLCLAQRLHIGDVARLINAGRPVDILPPLHFAPLCLLRHPIDVHI